MFFNLTSAIETGSKDSFLLLASASDLVLKSALIVLFVVVACYLFKRVLNASSRHLLWSGALFCIVLLPLLPFISTPTSKQQDIPSAFDVVTISVLSIEPSEIAAGSSSVPDTPSGSIRWEQMVLAIYFFVCAFLLLRVLRAAFQIRRIGMRAHPASSLQLIKRINALKRQLNISRTIVVKFSDEVASPLTYGLIEPVVIFPAIAKQWSEQTFKSALMHELGHVSRLDWLISTGGFVASALLWFNPFAWFALTRINIEAESACDVLVLQCGVAKQDYASDLLSITRSCKSANESKLLAQYMLSAQLLKSRVALLLNIRAEELEAPRFVPLLILILFAGLLSVLSAGKFLNISFFENLSFSPNLSSLYQGSRYTMPEPLYRDDELNLQAGPTNNPFEEFGKLVETPVIYLPGLQLSANERRRTAALELRPVGQTMEANQLLRVPAPKLDLDAFAFPEVSNAALDERMREPVMTSTQVAKSWDAAGEIPGSVPTNFSRGAINQEIERIETEYYRVFNSIEEDKSLHILCGEYVPTGSFIAKRYCEPRFIVDSRSASLNSGVRDSPVFSSALRSSSALLAQNTQQLEELTSALNQALIEEPYLRELHNYLQDLKASIAL